VLIVDETTQDNLENYLKLPKDRLRVTNPICPSMICDVLESIWPIIREFLEQNVLKNVETIVGDAFKDIKLLKSFAFTKLSVGEIHPRIENIEIIHRYGAQRSKFKLLIEKRN
jgi:hypothetical protein